MQKNLLLSLMLCLCSLAYAEVAVAGMTESERESAMMKIGKIQFDGNQMLFVGIDGTILAAEPINKVRAIRIASAATTGLTAFAPALKVYPNPTSDMLFLEGVAEQDAVRVFDFSGKCVLADKGASVDVSRLPDGIYLLQVGMQIVKFIKQ